MHPVQRLQGDKEHVYCCPYGRCVQVVALPLPLSKAAGRSFLQALCVKAEKDNSLNLKAFPYKAGPLIVTSNTTTPELISAWPTAPRRAPCSELVWLEAGARSCAWGAAPASPSQPQPARCFTGHPAGSEDKQPRCRVSLSFCSISTNICI